MRAITVSRVGRERASKTAALVMHGDAVARRLGRRDGPNANLARQAIQPWLFEIAFLPGQESRFRLQFKELNETSVFRCL